MRFHTIGGESRIITGSSDTRRSCRVGTSHLTGKDGGMDVDSQQQKYIKTTNKTNGTTKAHFGRVEYPLHIRSSSVSR